jgi:hypothetical protein
MKKLVVLFVFFIIYFLLLVGINILHFRYFTVHVVLYSSLADVVAAAAVVGIALFVAVWRSDPDSRIGITLRQLTSTELMFFGLCAILAGYIFAITVPTVIDRSLSIYILEKLDQRGGEIPLSAMRNVFVNEYVPEHRLVDVRLTEQLGSGTITVEDGCVKLTPRGKRIVGFTRFYRTNLLPKKRALMGEITDDLVDPFRNSKPAFDYSCESREPKTRTNRE